MTNSRLVVDLFKTNDVVLLGEAHGIRENLDFVCDLIPDLFSEGVKNIALEFACEEMQTVSDDLIDSDEFNPQIAREMLFSYNAGWPYIEYQSVHKAVWKFNQGQDEKMRILHPSYIYDWSKWNGIRDDETMRQIMHRGHYNVFRADRIGKVLESREKVLGLFGAFHAISNQPPFEIPDWLGTDQTLGQLLKTRYPNRIASVNLNNAMAGDWDLEISLCDSLTLCQIDYEFLRGHDFSEVTKNWPDPDWTPTPKDESEYWQIIEARKLV